MATKTKTTQHYIVKCSERGIMFAVKIGSISDKCNTNPVVFPAVRPTGEKMEMNGYVAKVFVAETGERFAVMNDGSCGQI